MQIVMKITLTGELQCGSRNRKSASPKISLLVVVLLQPMLVAEVNAQIGVYHI